MSIFFYFLVPSSYLMVGMGVIVIETLSMFGAISVLGARHLSFFEGAQEITTTLGAAFGFVSIVAFVFILLVAVVQIAMVEFRGDEYERTMDEKRLWMRTILSGLALLTPPVTFETTSMRLAAQEQTWAGFLSAGSLVYVVGIAFLFFSALLWFSAAQLFRFQR